MVVLASIVPSVQATSSDDPAPQARLDPERYLEVGDEAVTDSPPIESMIPIDPSEVIPDEVIPEIGADIAPVTISLENLTPPLGGTAIPENPTSEEPTPAFAAASPSVAAVGGAVQMGAAVAAAAYISEGPRWREIAPFLTLFSRLRRERLLDHPVREMIHEEIRRHAGIHYRELLRALRVSNGTLSFHLHHLERGDFVRSVRIRGRKHFYVTEREPGPEAYLVTDRQRQILALLRASPRVFQRDIAKELGISRSNVSYHVAALRSLGLIKTERVGNLSRCILQDP